MKNKEIHMNKYIIIAASLFFSIQAMDNPNIKTVEHYTKEIIEQPEQTLCTWGLNSYQQENSIETVALHHILKNSLRTTKNLIRRDTYHRSNMYDAFVSLPTLIDDKSKLPIHAGDLLNPGKTFFCTFLTQSNTQSPFLTAYVGTFLPALKKYLTFMYSWQKSYIKELIKDIHNRKYMTDGEMKNNIKTLGFNIISYERKICPVIIKNKEDFIQFHANLMTSDMINFMFGYISRKKLNKARTQFIDHIMKQLKTNDTKELIYQFDTTVAILHKPVITYD